MYCESFSTSLFPRLPPCLHAKLDDLTYTLLARPCLPRLDASQPIVNHLARLTIDRCLHHVATSTLLTNSCPESKPLDLHAFMNNRPLPLAPESRSPRNSQQLATQTNVLPKCPCACHCTRVTLRSARTRLSDVARFPHCTQPSISALLTSHGLVDSLEPSAHLSHARVEPSHDLSET